MVLMFPYMYILFCLFLLSGYDVDDDDVDMALCTSLTIHGKKSIY